MDTSGSETPTPESIRSDPRTSADFSAGPSAAPQIESALQTRIAGEVRFDTLSRSIYATDASIYEVNPIGVVFPHQRDDVQAVMEYCTTHQIPILPRGAGTSLAGQAVNEAIILDFTRYMADIGAIDPDTKRAVVQPGLRLGDLNKHLESHGLHFAPDPAWGDKSTIGGAIGNNSTGSHSLVYGKTDAYIEEVEVVLADGTIHRFGSLTLQEWENRANEAGVLGEVYEQLLAICTEHTTEIQDAYPDLHRNVSGYNLGCLLDEYKACQQGKTEKVNLAKIFAGSEGTLGIVTEATLILEERPNTKSVALLGYEDLAGALADVHEILQFSPAAVEILDDVLLSLARDTNEFGPLIQETIPKEVKSILLIECYAEDDRDGKAQIATILADRMPDYATASKPFEDAFRTEAPARATFAAEAHEKPDRDRFWQLRKSGLPILLSRTTDEKHISFIEDVAVPPKSLPAFVSDFQTILAEHNTFASFYGHAGPGCLHIRPLVNTKTQAGVSQLESIAEDVSDLVLEYDGAVSGEHGDGRARSQWNRKLYGEAVFNLFQSLKDTFDPNHLCNPGQICGSVQLTENLRFDPNYSFEAGFDPVLDWQSSHGLQGMVELCHGCGGCRGPQKTTGAVMCPTYRAENEEILSTRGRANALRATMTGSHDLSATDTDFLEEVLDLCIGCKGCATDCPSEVDMAKLKAEVTHAANQARGIPLRARVFANIDHLIRLGARGAPLTNWLQQIPGSRTVLEATLGIAKERELPTFERRTFHRWFSDRSATNTAEQTVVLLTDPYSRYVEPSVAIAAVEVLEHLGYDVFAPKHPPTGRAAYSQGMLEYARTQARSLLQSLEDHISQGDPIVAIEPSDAVMIQSDYQDLLGDGVTSQTEHIYGLCEYLDTYADVTTLSDSPSETLIYHGHCHQKATKRDHHALNILEAVGYTVEQLDSTCCGMAGSFGYEAEHYSLSQAIGEQLFTQVDATRGVPVAPGASCRTQLGDRDRGIAPSHPIEKLAVLC